MFKLSASEIINIRLQLHAEAETEHIMEEIKSGEQPAMGGETPSEDVNVDVEEKDDDDDSAEENTTRQYTKDAMPYDPIGTRELPGYPKNYAFNEDGEEQINDKLADPEDEEMKKTLDFIRKKTKNNRAKKDMFDKTIADIMKYDHVVNDMMGNLIKDQQDNKLQESTLSLIKATKN